MYNIDPIATEQPLEYGIDPGPVTTNLGPLNPEIAERRADRAQYSGVERSVEDSKSMLMAGEENILRDEAASKVSLTRKLQRDQFVIEFAKQKKGPLSPEETKFFEALFDKAVTSPSPETVIEEEFAKRRVAELDRIKRESFMLSAREEIPEELSIERSKASALNTKIEYARTKAENAFQTLSNQSYVGYGVDFLKNIAPLYQDIKFRNLVQGVASSAGLTGTHIDAQIDHLMSLPFPEFKATLDRIMLTLEEDNPQLAVQWAQSVLGRSTADTFLQNAFPLVDVLTLPVAGLIRAGLRKVGLINNTRKAMQDVTKGAAITELPSKVVLPAAAGDLAEAGSIKAAMKIVNDARGETDLAKEAIEALPAHFDVMATQVKAAPGQYGIDLANRIAENLHKVSYNITKFIAEHARVERLPVSVASEEVINKTWDRIRGLYVRLNDGVIGMSVPRKVPATNTYHVDMQIARLNGELFSSELEADGIKYLFGLPEAKPVQVMQEVAEKGFTTAKGSKYIVKEDGTTIRDKAARPEHPGDKGIKPQSEKTVYITEDEARALAPPQGRWRLVDHGDGTVSMATYNAKSKKYGISPSAKNIKYSTTPEVGKVPVEMWKQQDMVSHTAYGEVHFGNKITELTTTALKGEDGKIVQQGVGWYLSYTRPFKETDDIVRDYLLATTASRTPDSWASLFTNWLSKFRTSEDIFSEEQRMNRKVSVYAPSGLIKIAKENTEEIRKLAAWALPYSAKKKKWLEWKRVIEDAKRMKDPNTGEDGYFFTNPVDLADHYMKYIKRLPDEQEIAAYFAYVSNHEMDLVLRNMGMYRNKIREGAELHRFYRLMDDGTKVFSGFFDGVLQKEFPGGEENVLFTGTKMGEQRLYTAGRFEDDRKMLEEGVKSGRFNVIKVLLPETRPLQTMEEIGDKRVAYVITPNIESKAIPFNQINRRGGGHFEYDYDWYVKQPKIISERIGNVWRQIYEGDTTIMPISLRAMGKDVAKKLDEVRKYLLEGKVDEAKAYAQRNLAAIEWKEIHSWFKPSFTPDAVKLPPRLSLNEPIQLAKRGELLFDSDASIRNRANITDGTKKSFLDRVEFSGQRDAHEMFTLRDIGTRYNPLYAREDIKYVDPITSMDRSLTRIINSTYLDDYKMFSIEHWLREAGDPVKGVLLPTEAELRSAPYYHFHNPRFAPNADPAKVELFKAQHFQIKQLLGMPNKWETFLQTGAQSLSDMIYKYVSPKALNFPLLDPINVIPILRDPARFARAVTFHSKLGMFNPVQLLVQSQTYVTIAGVAGLKYAVPGTKGAMLHMYSRINKNPEIIDYLDKLASSKIIPGTATFKPGQFKEAMELADRTGFLTVAGEYALRDSALTPQIVQRGGKAFLDAGAFFFTQGEKNVRAGSWYTAYLRYRAKKPTGRVTDADLRAILNDADTLSVNMSRASSSMLHTGIMSIPSQFLSYQIRMAELFFSKRIGNTAAERSMARARILFYNSVLYGVPTAAGVTGFPFGDIIRQYALENGYTVGESYLTSLAEGLPSVITAYATGIGDFTDFRGRTRTGNYYNYGDRFGVQGFETIREAMLKDNWWLSLVTGAAGSTIGGAIESAHPMYAYIMGKIKGAESGHFRTEDLIRPFREVSSINLLARYIALLNTGKWESKKDAWLTSDVSKASGTWMTILGVQPQEVADLNHRYNSNRALKEVEKKAWSKFNNEWQRGVSALHGNNDGQAEEHFENALWILRLSGYPEHKIGEAIAQANKRTGSMVDRSNWQNLIKDVPTEQKDVREESFRSKMKIKEEREKAR